MPRRSREKLVEHLHEQLRFMAKSGRDYDHGDISEAKRMATHVRTLVHATGASKPLLGQLGLLRKIRYHSQTLMPSDIVERSITPICSLVPFWSDGTYRPICQSPRSRTRDAPVRMFDDWWNESIANAPALSRPLSRRDVILALTNKEGGAHIDPKIKPDYEHMSTGEFYGWQLVRASGIDEVATAEGVPLIGNIAAAVARQVSHELLWTIKGQVDPVSGEMKPVTFVPTAGGQHHT